MSEGMPHTEWLVSEGMPPLLQAGARYGLRIPAGEDEIFARGSWDSQVGKTEALKVNGSVVAHVRVIAAEVAADGSGVNLTYEVVDLADG